MEEKGYREYDATAKKRLHPSKDGPPPEEGEDEPRSKGSCHECSGSKGSSGEESGLESTATLFEESAEQLVSNEMLSDLHEEALHATTCAQLVPLAQKGCSEDISRIGELCQTTLMISEK